MNQECSKVIMFRADLQKLDSDFICSTSLPDASVCVSFLGPFQGRTVLWNLTLSTLKHYRDMLAKEIPPSESGSGIRPFMEIKKGSNGVYPLTVCLDLAAIDEPVIKKTIIMMRNYKRLALGRMEFGRSEP